MTAPAPHNAYPLDWPVTRPRIERWKRRRSAFKQSFGGARNKIVHELELFGAQGVVLSTNIALRLDGLPYANEREPEDPGVSVWFNRKEKPYVLACDTYLRAWENAYAIARTLEALRQIERDGGPAIMEQAFTGFRALPAALVTPPPEDWWTVFGIEPTATAEEITSAFRRMAHEAHPDKGGSHEAMARVNDAYAAACREKGM